MNQQTIIDSIKFSLRDMAFGDIHRASQGGSKMGAFILASCFIDYLAGFYFGRRTTGHDYKEFVRKFLLSYDPRDLYHDLRCQLVHNYSEGGSYVFTDAERAGKHMAKIPDGRLIINLENFLTDVEHAMNEYFGLLETDSRLVGIARDRLKRVGLLTIGPVPS